VVVISDGSGSTDIQSNDNNPSKSQEMNPDLYLIQPLVEISTLIHYYDDYLRRKNEKITFPHVVIEVYNETKFQGGNFFKISLCVDCIYCMDIFVTFNVLIIVLYDYR
jgi:hypothetical protein